MSRQLNLNPLNQEIEIDFGAFPIAQEGRLIGYGNVSTKVLTFTEQEPPYGVARDQILDVASKVFPRVRGRFRYLWLMFYKLFPMHNGCLVTVYPRWQRLYHISREMEIYQESWLDVARRTLKNWKH